MDFINDPYAIPGADWGVARVFDDLAHVVYASFAGSIDLCHIWVIVIAYCNAMIAFTARGCCGPDVAA
jgi:hypothetical protein